jgi:chromate reductase
MHAPRILVIPGSNRTGSHNVRLAALMTKELALLDADATRISLDDYPLPIYDADEESKSGPPANAVRLKRLVSAQNGVVFVTPEYNASVPPLVKNAVDWISVVREKGEAQLAAFKGRAFGIASASPGRYGGTRSAIALRQILEIGCRAMVVPEQVSVPNASQAFDETGNLKDPRLAEELRILGQRLIDLARRIA